MRRATQICLGPSAGLNYVAYRRDAYLRLQQRWSPAPWELGPSDRFQWSKFMSMAELDVASVARTTVLKFPSHTKERFDIKAELRGAELGPWLARVSEPGLAGAMQANGRIRQRMNHLLRMHGSWALDDVDAALSGIGFSKTPAQCAVSPAQNGRVMDVPMTDAQSAEAEAAYRGMREVCGAIEMQSATALPDLGYAAAFVLEALFGWSQRDPLAALHHLEGQFNFFEDIAQAWTLRSALHARCGDLEQAIFWLDQAKGPLPDGTWQDLMKTRLLSDGFAQRV